MQRISRDRTFEVKQRGTFQTALSLLLGATIEERDKDEADSEVANEWLAVTRWATV